MDGRPVNASIRVPSVVAFAPAMLVAGMICHVFALIGIGGFGEGLVAGLGIGLFLAAPWLMTCYGFAGRRFRLLRIDGGYIMFGSAIIGAVLALF